MANSIAVAPRTSAAKRRRRRAHPDARDSRRDRQWSICLGPREVCAAETISAPGHRLVDGRPLPGKTVKAPLPRQDSDPIRREATGRNRLGRSSKRSGELTVTAGGSCPPIRSGRGPAPLYAGLALYMVRSRRLELPRVAPLPPQGSASTNSATTASCSAAPHIANPRRGNKGHLDQELGTLQVRGVDPAARRKPAELTEGPREGKPNRCRGGKRPNERVRAVFEVICFYP